MFEVSWREDDRVAVIRLHRPPANAIGPSEIDALDAALDEVEGSEHCRAVVFHSQERFFSAGADIALMGEVIGEPSGPEQLVALAARMQKTFERLERLSRPTLAALSGIAAGGGLELALACDIRIAEAGARLGLPEARIGLLPAAGGTQRLTAVAGAPVARRLVLTGELVDGAQAQRLGIVQDLAEDGGAFEAALDLARALAGIPPRAVQAIKRCLALAPSQEGFAAELEETLALYREPATRALIAEFLQRSRKTKRMAV